MFSLPRRVERYLRYVASQSRNVLYQNLAVLRLSESNGLHLEKQPALTARLVSASC